MTQSNDQHDMSPLLGQKTLDSDSELIDQFETIPALFFAQTEKELSRERIDSEEIAPPSIYRSFLQRGQLSDVREKKEPEEEERSPDFSQLRKRNQLNIVDVT